MCPNLFHQPPIYRNLGCFQVLTIPCESVIIILAHVIFATYSPRSEIIQSEGAHLMFWRYQDALEKRPAMCTSPCEGCSWNSCPLTLWPPDFFCRVTVCAYLWSTSYWCCSHAFRKTNSLRRTVQIAECSWLHRRAWGRVFSQPRTPTSYCENLIYPKCTCPNPPPQILWD